jgi:RNA polymerase sigma-70 factor (ECF subfamily)
MSATYGTADSGQRLGIRSDQTGEPGAASDTVPTVPVPRRTGTAETRAADTPEAESERGNTEALDSPEVFLRRLYEQYSRHLLSFVLKVNGRDWQWAEDVVQETMLRAWKHTRSLQQSDSPNLMPWLTTVARRIVLNDQRSRRTRPAEVGDALLALVTVQDSTDRMIQHTILQDALAKLTPAQRYAIVEKYYWSRTGEEVARTMGIPVGTVKSRIHYALRILRTILIERGVTF